MRRFPPTYMTAVDQTGPEIRYRWDDWDDEERPLDDDFEARLVPLSCRALVAFSIAISEWIIHRFSSLSDDPAPMQYLEAAWLQVIDWGYGRDWEDLQDYDDWRGPIRAPLWDAMERVMYAIREADGLGDGSLMCGWNDGLARLVLPDPAPYIAWRDAALVFLEEHHLRTSDDPLGEILLPDHFDPPRVLPDEQVDRSGSDLLHFAKHARNPFIKPETELREDEDFEGQPFVFDLKKDRQRRADW